MGYANVVKKNIPQMCANQFNEVDPEISFDDDGTTIMLPREFLMQSHKRWSTSCIGHFVGGGFSFKFVKERTMKLWSNCGLKNVFFSSKGYYTFEFETETNISILLGII